jgi:ADP-ribose pyrophosphatase YjhB (NUDIX family)
MHKQIFPEPTAGILIFNLRGELLLIRSHKWHGKYGVPGGHIELGESAAEAARREAREETGLDVEDIQFPNWQECIYDEAFWKLRHFIFLDFIARAINDKVILNDEAEAFVWINPTQALVELDMDTYTVNFIRKYLE